MDDSPGGFCKPCLASRRAFPQEAEHSRTMKYVQDVSTIAALALSYARPHD